jgi:hypothetical protein
VSSPHGPVITKYLLLFTNKSIIVWVIVWIKIENKIMNLMTQKENRLTRGIRLDYE